VQTVRMKSVRVLAITAALLLPMRHAFAESPQPVSKVGEEYEISNSYETSEQGSDGSSSSSSGRDKILERVIEVRGDGLVLEYDFPKDASVEARARDWQFPARVFKPATGPMQLLNRAELEARVERWLKAAKWTRAICGRWIFTWNAFRIECDPQSVIKTIETFDLRSADVREGATYHDADARAPGRLVKQVAGPNGVTFAAVVEVDPDAVHRARAESAVVVGEIMQKPVSLEAAFREQVKERVSGTISVAFESDSAGHVRRRIKTTKLETKRPDGETEISTATETLERQAVPPVSAPR